MKHFFYFTSRTVSLIWLVLAMTFFVDLLDTYIIFSLLHLVKKLLSCIIFGKKCLRNIYSSNIFLTKSMFCFYIVSHLLVFHNFNITMCLDLPVTSSFLIFMYQQVYPESKKNSAVYDCRYMLCYRHQHTFCGNHSDQKDVVSVDIDQIVMWCWNHWGNIFR